MGIVLCPSTVALCRVRLSLSCGFLVFIGNILKYMYLHTLCLILKLVFLFLVGVRPLGLVCLIIVLLAPKMYTFVRHQVSRSTSVVWHQPTRMSHKHQQDGRYWTSPGQQAWWDVIMPGCHKGVLRKYHKCHKGVIRMSTGWLSNCLSMYNIQSALLSTFRRLWLSGLLNAGFF